MMRFGARLAAAGTVAVLTLAAAAPVAAQQGQGQQGEQQAAPAGPPPQVDLVFEREIFRYPGTQRRNPFHPLLSDAAGPQFDRIRVLGIIYSSDPSLSVVSLTTAPADAGAGGGGGGQYAQAGSTVRLRVGESWGNTRILEIHPDRVVVEVTEFGVTEREVLTMPTRRSQGGS